jgi:two-component system LytT family response regulator/two-component system response regulator LytT
MIRCLVVDDELPAREELKYILSKSNKVTVVGEATHGLEALELYKKLMPDLVFLDIQMPQLNGIDVARIITKEDNHHIPKIIFVTAYDRFAIEAFEVNAIDYILKPISEERLISRIERIYSSRENDGRITIDRLNRLLDEIKPTSITRLSVYHNNKLIPINTKDIIYITIEGKHTVIVTINGKYMGNNRLNELYSKLDSKIFFRCHKSYILNLNFIETIEPWFNSTFNINLKCCKDVIPVSRKYSKKFKDLMNIE